ncbi:MAG: type VI secretion system Vgr family protein, partial [Azoarcus sp.]|nr:type VI secretion system Vgr family protein [Azoarcus sp.]
MAMEACAPLDGLPGQRHRLLSVATPLGGEKLVAERFRGREAVSECFRFSVECLSGDAHLDLRPLLGEEITLRLGLSGGGERRWHGVVTEASSLGSDGGLARYRLVLEPWLAFLGLRHDCRVFRGMTALEILGDLFGALPSAAWGLESPRALRRRASATQYRESDLAFARRLLSEEGLSWRFDHDQVSCAGDGAAHARHRLVVFDGARGLPAEGPAARCRLTASEADDALQSWRERRHVHATAASRDGWRPERVSSPWGSSGAARAGLPLMEDYACAPAAYADSEEAHRDAELRLRGHESQSPRWLGSGTARRLAAGLAFDLLGPGAAPGREAARFAALSVEHEGASNLGAALARRLGRPDAGRYRCAVLAQPASRGLVPVAAEKPAAPPQTAFVVGAAGRDHRVSIRYPWERAGAGAP